VNELIYLAGRYSRRVELAEYAKDLEKCGAEVTSTWLKGLHAHRDDVGEANERENWAKEDLYDINRANTLLLFTDSEPMTRGGCLVEFGVALAQGKNVAVIGPRTHVFCYLPDVMWWPNWGSTPWMQKPTIDLTGLAENTNTSDGGYLNIELPPAEAKKMMTEGRE